MGSIQDRKPRNAAELGGTRARDFGKIANGFCTCLTGIQVTNPAVRRFGKAFWHDWGRSSWEIIEMPRIEQKSQPGHGDC